MPLLSKFAHIGIALFCFTLCLMLPLSIASTQPSSGVPAGYASVGAYHSLVIDVSGNLWVFGDNSLGQLGIGNEPGAIYPRCLLNNVRTAEAGDFNSFVISTDSTLWAFGKNSQWELGSGTYGNRYLPAPVLTRMTTISPAASHVLGLDEEGNVWSWGGNKSGQLGIGLVETLSAPRKVLSGASQVLAGSEFSMAVGRGYTLWAWGNLELAVQNKGGRFDLPCGQKAVFAMPQPVFSQVMKVAAGTKHYLALREDDSVWAWGNNSEGQVGDSGFENRLSPVKVLDNVADIAAGPNHSLALDRQGGLWGWGANQAGQLGFGESDEPRSHVSPRLILSGIVQIFSSDTYTLALDEQDRLWFMGRLSPPEFPEFEGISSATPQVILQDVAFAAPGRIGRAHV